MRAANYPKLLFTAMPGAVTTPAFAAEFAGGQKNLEVVELPSGVHFHQEDHPQSIGSSVADWISRAERVKLKSRRTCSLSDSALIVEQLETRRSENP